MLDGPSGPKEWSVRDVMAHLLACGDVWGKSITRMLAEDRPTIRYVSPRTWIRKTDYLERTFPDLFERYSAQRSPLLDELGALSLADWSRSATIIGKVGEDATVATCVQNIVGHEKVHLAQITSLTDSIRNTRS